MNKLIAEQRQDTGEIRYRPHRGEMITLENLNKDMKNRGEK